MWNWLCQHKAFSIRRCECDDGKIEYIFKLPAMSQFIAQVFVNHSVVSSCERLCACNFRQHLRLSFTLKLWINEFAYKCSIYRKKYVILYNWNEERWRKKRWVTVNEIRNSNCSEKQMNWSNGYSNSSWHWFQSSNSNNVSNEK